MKSLLRITGWCALLLVAAVFLIWWQRLDLFRVAMGLPPFQNTVTEPETVYVAMSDGVRLATKVYKPEGAGPWPAVLIRDPYGFNKYTCPTFAGYGFACVQQDTRGRLESEGQWYPVINERQDGLETLNWLAEQPWQNGSIATYGSSYVGLVQWSMIDAMPAEVKTVIADVSHGDWYRIVHRNGHFVQGVMSNWAQGLHRSESTIEDFSALRPLTDGNSRLLGGEALWYEDYLNNNERSDPYWDQGIHWTVREAHRKAGMPVLMTAGWHDFFLEGQLEVFEQLPRRAESLLKIRNGSHFDGFSWETIAQSGNDLRVSLQWLQRHLMGLPAPGIPESGYLIQSNTDGSYQAVAEWPQSGKRLTLNLNGLDQAGSCDGGQLSTEPTVDKTPASYTYNPLDPTPTRGGSYNLTSPGRVEQSDDICQRGDVLSFNSAPFENGLTVTGSITTTLEVSSDAADSAFTVKVQEKFADGRVLNIRDDISSLSYRNGAIEAKSYSPGSRVELILELTPIKWALSPGSSIRLDISSSNSPMYSPHPNLAGNPALASETRIARQTLYRGTLQIPLE